MDWEYLYRRDVGRKLMMGQSMELLANLQRSLERTFPTFRHSLKRTALVYLKLRKIRLRIQMVPRKMARFRISLELMALQSGPLLHPDKARLQFIFLLVC